jgi:hypothetical protein
VGSIMGLVANPSTSGELLFSRHSSLPQLFLIKKDHTIERTHLRLRKVGFVVLYHLNLLHSSKSVLLLINPLMHHRLAYKTTTP